MRKLKAADLFAGAGGTSKGAEQGGATLVFALNHWEVAVKTHAHNFPNARHVNSRLDACSPSECDAIDILFASPECTHHSRARGGRPTTDQQRAGAWDVMKWVEHHRPSFVVIENVREFEDWGPVGNDGIPLRKFKGRFFQAWVMAIQSAGYRVEWNVLNAADHGAATSRDRLFVICRKGNRSPVFPEPTHGKPTNWKQRTLAGMGLLPWRSAAEIIDWSIECPSVFARKHPLRDKTLARIEAGVDRFVGPFVAKWDNHSSSDASCVRGLDQPLATLVTKANQGLAVPLVASTHFGGQYFPADDRPCPTIRCKNGALLAVPFLSAFHNGHDGSRRNYDINAQIPVIDTQNRYALTVPFLADVNHGADGSQGSRTYGIDESLGTITTKRGKAVVTPLVVNYYGNGSCSEVSSPLGTITTKDRFALVPIALGVLDGFEGRTAGERSLLTTMERLGVLDIGFRMLANHELSAAQGFPTDYWFAGTKADVTRQIGNSVSPHVAKSITEALCA